MSAERSLKSKPSQPDESREVKLRIEANELRARDIEAQARVIEARLRLADAQAKLREKLSPSAAKP